jgi:hypothetical protein
MKTSESEPRAEEFWHSLGRYTPHLFRLSEAFASVGRKTRNRGDDVAIMARLLRSIFRSRAERQRLAENGMAAFGRGARNTAIRSARRWAEVDGDADGWRNPTEFAAPAPYLLLGSRVALLSQDLSPARCIPGKVPQRRGYRCACGQLPARLIGARAWLGKI